MVHSLTPYFQNIKRWSSAKLCTHKQTKISELTYVFFYSYNHKSIIYVCTDSKQYLPDSLLMIQQIEFFAHYYQYASSCVSVCKIRISKNTQIECSTHTYICTHTYNILFSLHLFSLVILYYFYDNFGITITSSYWFYCTYIHTHMYVVVLVHTYLYRSFIHTYCYYYFLCIHTYIACTSFSL